MTLRALVDEARALGRAAEPSTFHTRTLAALLGWEGDGLAATVTNPRLVRDAQHAHALLVPVEGGVAEVDAALAHVEPVTTLDGDWARVQLPSMPARTRECDVHAALASASIVLCADALGAAEAALDAAVAHVTTRVQHGRPLAAHQVVRHRCADMLIDVLVADSAVLAAVDAEDIVRAAARTKAAVIERCRRVTAAAHQLAGGQGVLADAPFHRWYRRVKMAEPALGTNREHRARLAASLIGPPAGDPASARR